jgi:hypothetical protein
LVCEICLLPQRLTQAILEIPSLLKTASTIYRFKKTIARQMQSTNTQLD